MKLSFSRKAKGIHTANVSDGVRLVLSSSGSVFGWNITIRNNRGAIVARLGSGIRTLPEAKQLAAALAGSAQFPALLLRCAVA